MTTTITPTATAASAAPTPEDRVTIDAAALWGLLSDLMLSAGHEACLPTILNGILLHTAIDAAGSAVLVGTSTDRFMLAQAHEPIGSGRFPQTFLRVPAVRALLSVLGAPDDPDEEAEPPGPAVLSVTADTVTLTHAGQTVQVAWSSDWYPATALAPLLTEPQPVSRAAFVAGSYLGVLAAVADRRDGRVVLTVQQPDRPMHANIGDRYRALVMPIKQDTAPTPPVFFPPSTHRQGAA
ncbi:MAG: hypothetical protein ACJ72N_24000 [Labedaea sp.]